MRESNEIRLTLQKDTFKVDVELNFPVGQCLALWGPSGSGKTTILRAIAGLEKVQSAYINIGAEVWQDSSKSINLPTFKRAIGFVFQEASIFPHLSVEENLNYAVRRNRTSLAPSYRESIVDLLEIKDLMHKSSAHLSGGEGQRVAIARTLLSSPKMLLLDEPLSAVDVNKKEEVLPWLERIRRELSISMVYVSHSLDELTRLADSVVVLRGGSILSRGSLVEVLTSADALIYRDAQEPSVFIDGLVTQIDPKWHLVEISFQGGVLWIKDQGFKLGQRARVKINAADVSIATELPSHTSIQNIIPAVISDITELNHPGECLIRVNCQGTFFLSKITSRAVEHLALGVGRPIWIQVKSVALLK